MRASLHIAVILLTSLLALDTPTPAHAGPFDNIIPKGIPNPFGHNDLGKQAQDFLRDQLGKALGEEAPFVIDPNQAFQQVAAGQAPTADNFKPTALKTLADLNRPLTPGDYSFNAMFYCTQWSVHRPGRGHPYTIGRAQGKLARQMSTLLYRGTIKHIAPSTMNAMAWRIQAGVPLNQWPDQEKTLVHQLTPEYESDLQGDWLQRIEDKYNNTFRIVTRKSFDDELRTIGDLGQLALSLKAAHQTLSDKRVVPERLPDLMFQQFGSGGNPQLPDDPDHPSPWMSVATGVMARFTVHEGNLGENLVELRVTPEASGNATGTDKGPTLSEIVNGTGTDEGRGLVGYSPDSQSPLFDPTVKDDPDTSNGSIKIVSYYPVVAEAADGIPEHSDPNVIVLPLQAQITPTGKASSVHWEFTLRRPTELSKPEGEQGAANVLSFDLSAADCVDKVFKQRLDLKALNLEGELTITAQAEIDNKSKSDSVKVYLQPITDDFSVHDVPSIMRNIGANMNNPSWYKAAQLLDYWFDGQPFEDPKKTLNWSARVYNGITLDWILSSKSAANVYGNVSHRATKAYDLLLNMDDLSRILTRPNAEGTNAIDVLKKHLMSRKDYKIGATLMFPIPNITQGMYPNQEIHNQHVQHLEVNAPSLQNWDAPLDPLFAAAGTFSFYLVPIGVATIDAKGPTIIIKKIAVYTASSFHYIGLHNRPWGLGYWKKPDKLSPIQSLALDFTYVEDDDYIAYRRKYHRGGDFILLSDIHIITLPDSIEVLAL